jgi:hypothetical protein
MLDDNQRIDKHDTAALNNEKPTFKVTDPYRPSPNLSSALAEPGTDDKKNAQNGLTQYATDYRRDDKEERRGNLHEDRVPHNTNLACGEGGGDSIDSDAPASAGLIHNIFAEYKKIFSMPKRKQKAVGSTLHNYKDSDIIADPISPPIRHEEPLAVTDDGITGIEPPIVMAGDKVGPNHYLRREFRNKSTPRPRRESNRQGTEIDNIRSEYLSTFTGDYHLGKFYTGPIEPHSSSNIRIIESPLTRGLLSRPRITADKATRSDPGPGI